MTVLTSARLRSDDAATPKQMAADTLSGGRTIHWPSLLRTRSPISITVLSAISGVAFGHEQVELPDGRRVGRRDVSGAGLSSSQRRRSGARCRAVLGYGHRPSRVAAMVPIGHRANVVAASGRQLHHPVVEGRGALGRGEVASGLRCWCSHVVTLRQPGTSGGALRNVRRTDGLNRPN